MIVYAIFLRALAAILITNSHYGSIYPISLLASGGLLGDVLFFSLSGFGLVNIKNTFPQWYRKRLLRIYPSVWVITVIYLILGLYKLEGYNLFEYLIYPTYYHFVASIIVLYIVYYFVMRYKYLRDRLMLIGIICSSLYLIVYVFLFDKSYYHIDNVREPMIRFLFFLSMLIGAFFRLNHDRFANSKGLLKWLTLVLLLIAYFLSKISFVKFETFSNYQILNQGILLATLFQIYLCFASISAAFERINFKLKRIINLIANHTLEIYLVQYVIISSFPQIIFPLNFGIVTILIICSAFLLKITSKFLEKIALKFLKTI